LGGHALLNAELLLPYLSEIFDEGLSAVGSVAFGGLGGVLMAESEWRQQDCSLLSNPANLFHHSSIISELPTASPHFHKEINSISQAHPLMRTLIRDAFKPIIASK
jgi:hypothetical protein